MDSPKTPPKDDMKINRLTCHRGFSLIELLATITIMGMIAVVGAPALSSFGTSNRINQTAADLADLLEQARQYAVAHNTYVWVTFSAETVNQTDILNVAVVSSKDGTDPASYGAVPGNNLELAGKVRVYENFQLGDAGAFTSAQVPSLPPIPTISSANGLSAGTPFDIIIPGKPSPSPFTKSIRFSPSGRAQNSPSPIDTIEFSLQPSRSETVLDSHNIVVIRVNGLTGLSHIYRN